MSKEKQPKLHELAEDLNINISTPRMLGETAYERILWVFNTSKKLSTYIDKMNSVAKKENLSDPEKGMIMNHVHLLKEMNREDAQHAIDEFRTIVKDTKDEDELNRFITYILSTTPENIFVSEDQEDAFDEIAKEAVEEEEIEEEKQMNKHQKEEMVTCEITNGEITLKKAERLVSSEAFKYFTTVLYEGFRAAKSVQEYAAILVNDEKANRRKLNQLLGDMKSKEVNILEPLFSTVMDASKLFEDRTFKKEEVNSFIAMAAFSRELSKEEFSLLFHREIYKTEKLNDEIYSMLEKHPKLYTFANTLILEGELKGKLFDVDSNNLSEAIEKAEEEIRDEAPAIVNTPKETLELYGLTSNEIKALVEAGRVKPGHHYTGKVGKNIYMMTPVLRCGFYQMELGGKLSEVM